MPSIYDLPLTLRGKGSVLVVATGPSSQLALDWSAHFDAVACVQQAGVTFRGLMDYLLVMDWQVARDIATCFDAADCFICPEKLLSLHDQNDQRSLEWAGIPRHLAITFPVDLHRADNDKAWEQVRADKMFSPWITTPTLLSALSLIGFREMFVLGCSDREGKIGLGYERKRLVTEYTAEALNHEAKHKVHFWTPASDPTRWREQEPGYVMI
jgi:hypothetical protein